MSARLVWSYILLWRNHLKAQPPRPGLIGAKTKKQQFDLPIRFYEENATSEPQNMLRHIKSSTRYFDLNNWILVKIRRAWFGTELLLRLNELFVLMKFALTKFSCSSKGQVIQNYNLPVECNNLNLESDQD